MLERDFKSVEIYIIEMKGYFEKYNLLMWLIEIIEKEEKNMDNFYSKTDGSSFPKSKVMFAKRLSIIIIIIRWTWEKQFIKC